MGLPYRKSPSANDLVAGIIQNPWMALSEELALGALFMLVSPEVPMASSNLFEAGRRLPPMQEPWLFRQPDVKDVWRQLCIWSSWIRAILKQYDTRSVCIVEPLSFKASGGMLEMRFSFYLSLSGDGGFAGRALDDEVVTGA